MIQSRNISVALISGFLLFNLNGCNRQEFLVSSESMSPTLKPGDRLTLKPGGLSPGMFDVILFRRKESDADEVWAMRVVGVAGDRIVFRDDGIYRNGAVVDLSTKNVKYSNPRGRFYHYAVDAEYTVPSGTVFVMGDNVRMARDSRVIGPIPLGDILGIVER